MAGTITQEELDRLRSKIGQRVRISEKPYLTEVTSDAIRHWAEATGDRNPLFVDVDYATNSSVGRIVAPPTMLYAFDRLSIGYRGGLPGVHSMFGGTNWQWLKHVHLGDRIYAEVVFKDLIEHTSQFAGRSFQQISTVTYRNQDEEVVAVADAWGMRTERSTATKRGRYNELTVHTYSDEELEDITAAYKREVVRGAEPRYWEDVLLERELDPIVRGPYTGTTAVAFEQAWGGLFIRAHGYWFDYLERHPHAGIRNDSNVPEPPEKVHWDEAFARQVGVPSAYDYGPERITWLATLLTNWMGDRGFLRTLNVQVRRFNLFGDTTWCRARVTGKTPGENDRGFVELDVWAEDQRGQKTAFGTASIELPMRGALRSDATDTEREAATSHGA